MRPTMRGSPYGLAPDAHGRDHARFPGNHRRSRRASLTRQFPPRADGDPVGACKATARRRLASAQPRICQLIRSIRGYGLAKEGRRVAPGSGGVLRGTGRADPVAVSKFSEDEGTHGIWYLARAHLTGNGLEAHE
jgi:hypothetical protein